MADKMRRSPGTWPQAENWLSGGSITAAAACRPTLFGYRLLLRSKGALADLRELLRDAACMAPIGPSPSRVVFHVVGDDPRDVLCADILRESRAEVVDRRCAAQPLLSLPDHPLLLYDGTAKQGLSAVWRELLPIATAVGADLVISDADHQLAPQWCREFAKRVFHHAAITGRGVAGLPSRCTRYLSGDGTREIGEDLENAAVRIAFARESGPRATRAWFGEFPVSDLQGSLYCLSHRVVEHLSRRRRLQAYFESHEEGWAGDLLVVFEIVAARRFHFLTESVVPNRPVHPSTMTFTTLAKKWHELEEYLNVELGAVQRAVVKNLECYVRSDCASRHSQSRRALVRAIDDVCRSYRQAFRALAHEVTTET